MTTFVYRSSDTGAPSTALTTAGAIAAILDAILIDGYNALTGVTVTRSGAIATYTKTGGHNFAPAGASAAQLAGVIVQTGGFDQAEYNQTGAIFNVTSTTWQMNVSGSPATTGTGAGTAKRAPMKYGGNAWTTAFTASNKRTYRQPTGTNGFYLYVDNNATRSAAQCDVLGFESASAMGVGTGQFPHALILSQNSLKSTLYLATTGGNKWMAVGNGRLFYLLLYSQGANSLPTCLGFGDFRSVRSGDTYNCLLQASASDTNTTDTAWSHVGVSPSTLQSGQYIARGWHQCGSAQIFTKTFDGPNGTSTVPNSVAFPNPADNAIYFIPIIVSEYGQVGTSASYAIIRGSLPMWSWMHGSSPAGYGDAYVGSGVFSGRMLECVAINTSGAYPTFIEISDTWDT